jgi:arabinan endo-1,5-alpha-L-arabinosidase
MGGTASVRPLKTGGAVLDVHDPSPIVQCGGFYYLYSTGANIPIRRSVDLRAWEQIGNVFTMPPIWTVTDIPAADGAWAPDISFFEGRYHLYYAVSTFGSNRSEIGLATNITLDPTAPGYDWVDEGKVVESFPDDDWNAIDPSLAMDADGQPWLVFGSYWSGIKLTRIEAGTGKPDPRNGKLVPLAKRPDPPDAIEAPFIVYREGYYYLFASYDFCCRGADSTYNVRVGRSRAIAGPYEDRGGVSMLDGGGTVLVEGKGRWRGPGGESVFRSADGAWFLVYHSYDGELGGAPTLKINPIKCDGAGWPVRETPEN